MDWSEVHAEAEELEHAVSDRLIERMDEMLGFPSVDPHGDPIPDVHGVVEETVLPSLLDCELGAPLRWRGWGTRAATSSSSSRARPEAGERPGVESRDEAADTVELRLDSGERSSLGFRAASKIFVEGADQPALEAQR